MSEENNDSTESSGYISHAIIDMESGTTVSGTTNLPSSLFQKDQKERDVSASQLFIKTHEDVEVSEDVIAEAMPNLLQASDTSQHFQYGNNMIFLNSQFYGPVAGGDAHQTLIYVEKWSQIKNDIDTDKLLAELGEAVHLAQEKAKTNDERVDLANLTLAKNELEKRDGPTMLKHLAKVGSFGRDIAVSVIAGVLSQIMSGKL